MASKEKSVGAILKYFAVLPVAHVVFCYWYLFCFHAGFGGGSFNLADSSDIFFVSISKLAGTYVIFTISGSLVYFLMFHEPEKMTSKRGLALHQSFLNDSADRMFKFLFYICLLGILVNLILNKTFVNILAVGLCGFLVGSFLRRIADNNEFDENILLFIGFAFVGLLNLSLTAYKDGFSLRNSPTEFLQKDVMQCNSLFLHQSVGDNFLAVSDKGERLVVNEDCEEIFRFPKSKVFIDML